jgi:hypothetical protein
MAPVFSAGSTALVCTVLANFAAARCPEASDAVASPAYGTVFPAGKVKPGLVENSGPGRSAPTGACTRQNTLYEEELEMRRSTVILLGALVALMAPVQDAVAQQGNGNGAVTYQVRNDRMFNITACGEVIDIAGWVEIKQVQVARGRDNSGTAMHVNGRGSGESLTSGAKYNWHANTLMRIAGSEWDGQFSNQTHQRVRLIGQGDAPNYTFNLHFRLNKNSNGEVTTMFRVSDVTCR